MTTATDTQNEQEYIPYGDDWAREMKRWKKDQLIDLLARCLKEHQRLRAALEGMVLGPAGRPTDLNALLAKIMRDGPETSEKPLAIAAIQALLDIP